MPAETKRIYTLCEMKDGPAGPSRPRRVRPWHLSPDGFRALRRSCFMSRKACAEFLGVSVRTVRYWDAGQHRVPWSAVRLLRLKRIGDLGALHDRWAGWIINERTSELVSPNGYRFTPDKLAVWPLLCEQARFWRQDFAQRAARGVGATAPALTPLPEAVEAAPRAAAGNVVPIGAAASLAAFARLCEAAKRAETGIAASVARSTVRSEDTAAARSDAGLVILSTSGTRFAQTRLAQGFRRMHGR